MRERAPFCTMRRRRFAHFYMSFVHTFSVWMAGNKFWRNKNSEPERQFFVDKIQPACSVNRTNGVYIFHFKRIRKTNLTSQTCTRLFYPDGLGLRIALNFRCGLNGCCANCLLWNIRCGLSGTNAHEQTHRNHSNPHIHRHLILPNPPKKVSL